MIEQNIIKQLRLKIGMDQRQFAKSLKIGQAYLSQIENGKEISENVVAKIHNKYNIPLKDLRAKANEKLYDVHGLLREIELLKQIIESQKQTISLLQKK